MRNIASFSYQTPTKISHHGLTPKVLDIVLHNFNVLMKSFFLFIANNVKLSRNFLSGRARNGF